MQRDHARWAVLLVNVGVEARDLPLTFSDVSSALGSDPIATDVWTGKRVPVAEQRATFARVAAHDSVFLFLEARRPSRRASAAAGSR